MAKTIRAAFLSSSVDGIKINSSYKAHSSNYNSRASRTVKYIVMHYTGNPKDNAINNVKYFSGANRSASAHFFVDDASIYQSVAMKDVAWHCGGKTYFHSACRNSNSIGIEMCCTAGEYRVSDLTKKHAAALCADLCRQLGIAAAQVDTYVLRHYDITHKSCPAQMVKDHAEWVAFKTEVKRLLGGAGITPVTPASGYLVRITASVLNVRAGAGTSYKVNTTVRKGEAYTIVSEENGWGKLKSGAGWISLKYTERI